MQPASARRADCRELRRAAIASLPRSTLPEQHPRQRRSHEISAPQARAPAASVLPTALRSKDVPLVPKNPRSASQCQNPKSLWLPSPCRTSIGIFAGFPPGPGAADARAAILYACSGLSTSITQYPARNSFDSGNTPSVTGSPLLPARTIFAPCGQASPFVSTKTPESGSSLVKRCITSTFLCRSSFDLLAYSSQAPFLPCIIKMYFMSLLR